MVLLHFLRLRRLLHKQQMDFVNRARFQLQAREPKCRFRHSLKTKFLRCPCKLKHSAQKTKLTSKVLTNSHKDTILLETFNLLRKLSMTLKNPHQSHTAHKSRIVLFHFKTKQSSLLKKKTSKCNLSISRWQARCLRT